MLSYEENVRAILQCCFSESKDEIIDRAVKCIMALKQDSVVVNPISPAIIPQPQVVPLPYYPITTSLAIICDDIDSLGDFINGDK